MMVAHSNVNYLLYSCKYEVGTHETSKPDILVIYTVLCYFCSENKKVLR